MSKFTFNWEDDNEDESFCEIDNFAICVFKDSDLDSGLPNQYNVVWMIEFSDAIVHPWYNKERTIESAKESAEKYVNRHHDMIMAISSSSGGLVLDN